MKIITKKIEVYKFEDMPEKMKKACLQAEKMLTPWFTGSYIWEYCREDILEELNLNEYEKDGEIFNVL